MTRDNVISFESGSTKPRQRVGEAKMRELANGCRKQLADSLPRLMQELFEHLDDELYELADKSASDVLQTTYFDAMRELRKLRGQIERQFIDEQLAAYDEFWRHPQRLADGDESQESEEMSLVEQDVLEENLAVSSMVSKAENRYHRELFALNLRFAHLAGIDDLSSQQNPVGPLVLAEGFRSALRLWAGDLGVRLVVFKLFDRFVMSYVGGIYDDLNGELVAAGILPKIVQTVRRNPVAPSVRRARGEEPGVDDETGEAPAEVEDGGASQQVLSVLADLLSDRRAGSALHLPSSRLPGTGAVGGHLPAVESGDLIDALHALQLDLRAESRATLAEMQELQSELLISLGRRLEMGTAEAPQKRLQQPDQDIIDVIGMLFDFILDDHQVPDPMKALIGRLQIPMLKVAVIDRAFFSDKQHPARRLLNVLAHASMGWVDDGDRSPRSLYGQIDGVVSRILREFNEDVGLFDELLESFTDYLDREERGAEAAEARVTQITRGQEQLLVARRRVAEVLNGFREQHPDLPSPLVSILREGWHDVMLLAYLREGGESEAWRVALDTVETLIWSVQPKVEGEDRQRLLKSIPELLKTLRDGLNNISFDPRRATELFRELQACHIAALRGDDDEPADIASMDDAIPSEILKEEPEPEVIEDDAMARAQGLAVGEWLEWDTDDGQVRGKLSWRSQVTNACIFVNRKGMKVAELHVNDIAALFRDNRGRLLEQIDRPLIDRALDAMVGVLNETKAGESSPTD